MEENPPDDFMIHSYEMRDKISNYKKEIEEYQNQLDELENQSVPNKGKIFNDEIKKISNLINKPGYDYEVEEKQEIIDNLVYYADEYKTIIKEIQDALSIIKSKS